MTVGLVGVSRGNEAAPSHGTIVVAGTFNDWNPSDPVFQMPYAGDHVYQLKKFFRAGSYKFKFTVDGGWDRHYGEGSGGVLTQPGTDIALEIPQHGAYLITLDTNSRSWKLQEASLDSPQPVITVRDPVELNLSIVLDGSESVAREDKKIRSYEFSQDTNDAVRAGLMNLGTASPQAIVKLPKPGSYRFWLKVNDGMDGPPESVTLKPKPSYQVVGDWTAPDPSDPASFLRQTAPGEFEKILKSFEPGDRQLILIQDHDEGQILRHLTVSVTQTNQQFWRVQFKEHSGELTCKPEDLVEFTYRPADDPILQDRVAVRSVHLSGSFNNWNSADTPMTESGDGTYIVYLRLEEGLHQYKFVVNGTGWMQDPNADPSLRVEDGHGGFNSALYIGARGEEFGPPPEAEINLAAVKHSPGQTRYFNVVSSDIAEIKIRTLRGDASKVVMHIGDNRGRAIAMRRGETAFGFDYWVGRLYTTTNEKNISYYFSLTDGPVTRTYGAGVDPEQTSGVQPFAAEMVERFPTPDWAKHVVWYQIFPERFRNGALENDPPRTVPWRWDWYKLASWEKPHLDRKDFSSDWYSRRFGGDLQGMIEKLPYFRDLGVTALYFCPVFEANSYHGYDTIDYRHIAHYFGFKGDNENVITQETLDPATWQWTPSDKLFLEFIQKAHAQGLKVIVDGVFNHMGKGSFALRDVLTNGVSSVYADWFDVTDWGPPVKYKSWDGGGWMPNFRKNSEHGIASETARKYLYDVTRRWMDPNGDGDPSDGIDGWRLDVAEDVPSSFWVEWRKQVKSINPRAYITGEVWGPATKHLQGDQWDAVMNYQFAMRAIRYFIDKRRKTTASELDRQLHELLALYPMQVNFVMQNLYDSHDTDRLVNMVINPDRDYDQGNRPQDGASYDGSKPGPDAYRVANLMATFQMTFLGAPMIWYGNEVGMFGADDPTDRKPMLWKDLQPYDNPQDFVMEDVWGHYRRLVAIRNSYPVLRTGEFQTLLTNDAADIYGFTRSRGDDVIAVVINNSEKDQSIEVAGPFPNGSRLIDVLTASPVEYYHASAGSLGFPNFEPTATVRALRFGTAATPSYSVRDGKIRVGIAKKAAAILVKQDR